VNGVSVSQVFNKAVADFITYLKRIGVVVVLFLEPFGMAWIIVSECA
jgi:hypothetical protein